MKRQGKQTKKQRSELINRWVELAAYVSVSALILLVVVYGQQIQNLQEQVDNLEMEQSL